MFVRYVADDSSRREKGFRVTVVPRRAVKATTPVAAHTLPQDVRKSPEGYDLLGRPSVLVMPGELLEKRGALGSIHATTVGGSFLSEVHDADQEGTLTS